MKNNPIVIQKSVNFSPISIRSFWDIHADEAYQNQWPQDRKLAYAPQTMVIVYSEKGRGIIELKSGAQIDIRGNAVLFLDPQTIVRYRCNGLIWKLYWSEVFTDVSSQVEFPYNKIIRIGNSRRFELQLLELKQELSRKELQHQAYAVAIFNKLVYEWVIEASDTTKTPHQIIVQNTIDEMHHRLTENWQVKDMAQFANCSEQHLRKLFLNITEQSPKEYYQNIKMDIAYSLLLKGGRNISQIAFDLGFSDAFHFSNAFKKKFAKAPSQVPARQAQSKNLIVLDKEPSQ